MSQSAFCRISYCGTSLIRLVVTSQETWNVHVYVDGRRLAVGLGAKNLTADTQLILGVYPRNGSVADIVRDNDTLSQPEATAYFANLT